MLPVEQFTPEPLNMSNKHLATEETDMEPSCIHFKTKGSDIMDHIHSCTDQDKLVVCAACLEGTWFRSESLGGTNGRNTMA